VKNDLRFEDMAKYVCDLQAEVNLDTKEGVEPYWEDELEDASGNVPVEIDVKVQKNCSHEAPNNARQPLFNKEPIMSVLKEIEVKNLLTDEMEHYQFAYRHLYCNSCCHPNSPALIMAYDRNYRHDLVYTNMWWESHFIQSFFSLVAHYWHQEDILVVQSQSIIQTKVELLPTRIPDNVLTVLSLMWVGLHFSLCIVDLASN
jgi:hypothetical protein